MTAPSQPVIYRLDQDNRLIFVNEEWHLFATANQADHLDDQAVQGRSIWEFIHDGETRQLHETLLNRVRGRTPLCNLPFRCNSPALRRFMAMDIIPLADNGVEYRCRLLRTEERHPVPLALDPGQGGPTPSPYVQLVQENRHRPQLLGRDRGRRCQPGPPGPEMVPPISHTMCDACLAELEK